VILGRGGRVLSIQDIHLANNCSMGWAFALHAAATAKGQHKLSGRSWRKIGRRAVQDLLPKAKQRQAISPLEQVLIAGNKTAWNMPGGQVQSWLIDNGWLHPPQIGGEA